MRETALDKLDVSVDGEVSFSGCQLVGGKKGRVRESLTTPLLLKDDIEGTDWKFIWQFNNRILKHKDHLDTN